MMVSPKDCCFDKHKNVVCKSEEENTSHEPSESKFNVKEVKDEHFDELKSIIPEEIHIKNEVQEDDQFKSSHSVDTGIKSEDFTQSHYTTDREVAIKFECEEEEQHNKESPQQKNISLEEFSFVKCENARAEIEEDETLDERIARLGKRQIQKRTRKYRKYICHNCHYETRCKLQLIRHIQLHHDKNTQKYSCNQCSYQTAINSLLKQHLMTHSEFGMICVLCQKSFNLKMLLDAHYLSKHPDQSDIWKNVITHSINECPQCDYKSIYTSHFKRHLASHGPSAKLKLKCNVCSYQCALEIDLADHMRIHNGRMPLVCTECYKWFQRKQQLDGHITSRHSDNERLVNSVTSKMHYCDKCDFKTARKSNMTRHLASCKYR